MTIITGHVASATDYPARGTACFRAPTWRPANGPIVDGIVDPEPACVTLDAAGDFVSPVLQPGPVEVTISAYGACPWTIVVTAPAAGSHDLADLIAASIPPPPATPAFVVSVGGLSGVITAAQIAGMVAANSSAATLTAQLDTAVPLSGHTVVTTDDTGELVPASATDPTHVARPLWLTTGAWAAGVPATVVAAGIVTEPTWSWTPGLPVFLGANGALTQAPPTAPQFLRWVAAVVDPTSLNFRPELPVVLAA